MDPRDARNGTTTTPNVLVTVTASGTIPVTSSVTSATYDTNPANNTDSTSLNVPEADLAITKTVNDATPNFGDIVKFTCRSATAARTRRRASRPGLLPAGLTYVSDDAAGDYSGGVWTIGTIANGAVKTSHQRAGDRDGRDGEQRATVSADTTTRSLANNVVPASISVDPAGDITAQIIVDDSTPDVGQPIAYTVTIHNAGPDNATGVQATIELPAGLDYVSDDGAYDPLTGVLTIGNLAAGDSVVLQIVATPNAPGPIIVHVVATSVTFDQDHSNNTDSVAISAPVADLVVNKTVGNATPNYLGTTQFTIKVRNDGPDDATGVVLHDDLPAGLTWVSDDSAGAYNPSTGDWTIGALVNGDTLTLHITARATATGSFVNKATVSAVTFDPTAPNNKDTAAVDVDPAADLSVTKTVDDATPNVGDVVTFTVTVHDAGPDDAHGVSVADVMPAGLVYVSDDGAGAYEPISGTWTIGTLAAGADTVIHMSATVTQSGPLVNTATVSATTFDPDLANNAASTSPAAAVAADLGVTDSVNDHTPSLGDLVTYTVVVTNHGPDLGTGVAVDFPIPAGFSYVSDDAAGA